MKVCCLAVLMMASTSLTAQKSDTITITPSQLQPEHLQTGTYCFLVFNKKKEADYAERLYLVNIKVRKESTPDAAILIDQQWEADTITHTAHTVLDGKTFATRQHDFFWKRLGSSSYYDFVNKTVRFSGRMHDTLKIRDEKIFQQSFKEYNLNWHSDLIVFSLLPYRANRTFVINYYDPGFGAPQKVCYTVTGTDVLTDYSGKKVECWVLLNTIETVPGYQKFWISKQTQEVLKEEDFFRGAYRYKLKVAVTR